MLLHHSTLCDPPSLSSCTFLLSLLFQSAFLHPYFGSHFGARLTRLALVIPNVYWSLRFPFRNCYTPLAIRSDANMGLAAIGMYFSMKSLEWGCVPGPFFYRPLREIDGVKRWVRKTDETIAERKSQADDEKKGMVAWTLLHFLSLRGHQFTWGPEALANKSTSGDLLFQMLKIHAFMRPALALLVLSSHARGGLFRNLLSSLGIPSFPGLDLLDTLLLNFSFGLLGYGCVELIGSSMALLAFVMHKVCRTLNLPRDFTEFFNPDLYPPNTRPIFQSPSLSFFWGKAWHQNLRRCLLICGGKPSLWLASRFGLRLNSLKFAGLLGAFSASAVFHEYVTMVMRQPPHPDPYIPLQSYPGPAIFFIVQPVGIMIQDHLATTSFRRFSASPWTTASFLLLTISPYRKACDSIFFAISPVQQWTSLDWLLPRSLASLANPIFTYT